MGAEIIPHGNTVVDISIYYIQKYRIFSEFNMTDTKSNIGNASIIEALIFASPDPVPESRLAKVSGEPTGEIGRIVEELNEIYRRNGRAFEIRAIGGGYAIYVRQDFAPWIEELLGKNKGLHLTRATFEALAVIAVKQPITKPTIDKIRRVNSSAPMAQLLKQGMITIAGRQKGPGRPFLYATTSKFLKCFGLNSTQDIPSFDELQKMFEGADEYT